MYTVVCPHCKSHQVLTTKVRRDVVVVMPCPSCHEWVILFRDKVIALSRKILEGGNAGKRRAHLAEVIAELLDAGVFAPDEGGVPAELEGFFQELRKSRRTVRKTSPISDEEFERFVKYELRRIDDPAYFKKHIGGR